MQRGAYQNRPTAHQRPEADPARRAVFENNKKIILATQSICGICGQPVDKSLKYPHPMSPTVDHIIPCNRGGSDDLENLQLAATDLGLGACWIHRAKQEVESEEGQAILKEIGIEGNYEGIGHCVVGYIDGDLPAAKPRKDDFVVWAE